ncbi:MAG: hypothetical protein WAO20_18910 [Acidobacteriota bacterium]
MTGDEERRHLRTWKEIAAHFDVSVRTAQRWEKEGGLPVHREAGGRPIAHADELDRWHKTWTQDAATPPRTARVGSLVAIGAVGLAILSLLAWWWWSGPGKLETAILGPEGKTILALDRSGRTLWTFELPDYLTDTRYDWTGPLDMFLVDDIDADGREEVLFNYRTAAGPPGPGILYCFDDNGALRWQRTLGRAIDFGGRDFDDDFSGHFMRLVRGRERSYLLTVALHRYWYPCQVALLDPATGKTIEEYWHPGGLSHCLLRDLDGDGIEEVVLAGINNPGDGLGHACLFALKIPFSEVPAKGGTAFAEFTGGREYRYALFPRPDVTFLNGTLILTDKLEAHGPDRLLVRLRLSASEGGYLFYFLDNAFRILEFRISDDVISLHDRMYVQGLLDHAWSEEEKSCLGRLATFPAAPDGNEPDVGSLWQGCEFVLNSRE